MAHMFPPMGMPEQVPKMAQVKPRRAEGGKSGPREAKGKRRAKADGTMDTSYGIIR